MGDEVWPLPAHASINLSSFNFIGFQLLGKTRTDKNGGRFATRWFMLGGPVVPLNRYYIYEGRVFVEQTAVLFEESMSLRVAGESDLRHTEIIRTYIYCWIIVPAVIVGPSYLLLRDPEAILDYFFPGSGHPGWAIFLLIGLFLLTLFGSVFALVLGQVFYQKRLAPLRRAVWIS